MIVAYYVSSSTTITDNVATSVVEPPHFERVERELRKIYMTIRKGARLLHKLEARSQSTIQETVFYVYTCIRTDREACNFLVERPSRRKDVGRVIT
jgi:regulator of PEP synthase PpsR (kinase-PPPase family)